MLYSLLQAISIVHLFIIQPCTQVYVLLSSFSQDISVSLSLAHLKSFFVAAIS